MNRYEIRIKNKQMDRELLHTYFRGETTPEQEKRIMDWAEAAPANYCAYRKERTLWEALLVNYRQKELQTTVSHRPLRSFPIWKIAGMAASLALLLTLSWMWFGKAPAPSEGWQKVLVPPGQRVRLQLEDGTQIWLNSNTTFSYPTAFGSRSREVELEGEGYFEVAKNPRKPFIVKTHAYDIKVLGTTFNVSAYPQTESPFETSLLTGSVEISGHDPHTSIVRLKPGEEVSEHNGQLQKDRIGNPDRFRWKEGLICLDDMPLGKLMEKLSRYYDIDIKIENREVSDYRCTGKFRQSDGIEYALRVLQRDIRFSYTRDDETNTLVIR